MIQAGKRKKEFADPYTVTGAVTKGNIITKLSLLIMGLGNIAHRQIAKGLMFLVVEIGYIWFMIPDPVVWSCNDLYYIDVYRCVERGSKKLL